VLAGRLLPADWPMPSQQPDAPVRVVLADDEPLMRAGLAALLSLAPGLEVVAEAENGLEAVAAAARERPDVVVMDLQMPVLDGVEATAVVRAAPEPPAVLVLTSFDDGERLLPALRAGARGYLLKSAAPGSLREAVLAVGRGNGWLDPAMAPLLISHATARPAGPVPKPQRLERLTAREREVLAAIATGWNNGEIAAQLVLSEGTVKTHVSRIFSKLGLRDRAQAVVLAYESGLVSPPR
jgi:DNA-binding NarL/FixJ family response regulator